MGMSYILQVTFYAINNKTFDPAVVWSGLVCFPGSFNPSNVVPCFTTWINSPVTKTDLLHLRTCMTHFHPLLMKNYMMLKAPISEMESPRRILDRRFAEPTESINCLKNFYNHFQSMDKKIKVLSFSNSIWVTGVSITCIWASQVAPVAKNLPANAGRHKGYRFDPWVTKIPWRRAQQATAGFLPRDSHGQRSL